MKTELSLSVDGSTIICELYGDIKNSKKILLFCHGFPGSSRLVSLFDNLENNSISIVEMNYRGDKKSEGKFSFLGSIKDIKTASNFLKEKYKLPLYALGYSMGGFYVSNIIINDSNVFEKVILLNPVVDSMSLFSNKLLMDELWQHAKNILSLKRPETYKDEIARVISDLNPIGFVKKLKNNIIIIQSTNDEVLEPKLAKKFYSLINSKKSYVEMPNKKHDLIGDEKELIDALRFHIK
ncbi:lysophospholipase [Flavobacteriaceae bacterium]|nr:lysophospholipase [Flavobacteriaceae bacterium]